MSKSASPAKKGPKPQIKSSCWGTNALFQHCGQTRLDTASKNLEQSASRPSQPAEVGGVVRMSLCQPVWRGQESEEALRLVVLVESRPGDPRALCARRQRRHRGWLVELTLQDARFGTGLPAALVPLAEGKLHDQVIYETSRSVNPSLDARRRPASHTQSWVTPRLRREPFMPSSAPGTRHAERDGKRPVNELNTLRAWKDRQLVIRYPSADLGCHL